MITVCTHHNVRTMKGQWPHCRQRLERRNDCSFLIFEEENCTSRIANQAPTINPKIEKPCAPVFAGHCERGLTGNIVSPVNYDGRAGHCERGVAIP